MSVAPTLRPAPGRLQAPVAHLSGVGSRTADIVAIATLAALTMVFFGRILFTDHALFWGDIMLGFYPAYDLWKQGIATGHLALWNPFTLGGYPQVADAQSGYFYPSILLNLVMPAHRALAVDLAVHVFVAGTFTYLFLRRQGVSTGPSIAGAMIFAFSGFMAVRVMHPPLIRSAAWLPLLLVIAGTFDTRSRARSALYLGLILGTQILAGHQQIVLISGLLLGCYTIWEVIQRRGPRRRRLQVLASFAPPYAAAILVAIVLAAVLLIPAAELVQQSDRSGGMDFRSSTVHSMPPEQLPMLLAPNLFGEPTKGRYLGKELYWEMTGYVGLVSILLAILGAVVSGRRDRIFWSAAALTGVALALGVHSMLYWMAYSVIPGVAYFRVPPRFLLWFGFAVAVLAAYGMEALRTAQGSRTAWRWVAACLAVGSLVAAYWALDAPGVRSAIRWLVGPAAIRSSDSLAAYRDALRYLQETGVSEGRRLALLWILGGMAVMACRMRRISFRVCAPALLLLVAIDLFAFGMNFYPTIEARRLSQIVPTEGVLDLENGAYRILTTPSFVNGAWTQSMKDSFLPADPDGLFKYRTGLVPNTNVQRQISNAYGYSPMYIHRAGQFLATAINLLQSGAGRWTLLDFLGARYVFTFADLGHIHTQTYHDGFYVWRNDRAMPRGWLVTAFEVLPTDAQIVRAFKTDWDPRRTVLLSQSPRETFGLRPRHDPGTITRRSFGLTGAAFDLALNGPAIFVLSDAYYPGWKASVDGVGHPIYRANHAFRAVFLPPGARHLEFLYQPKGVVVGGIISVVGWLAVLVTLAAGAVKRGAS